MPNWRAGELESWRAGELESWRAGELESWRAGELESWRAGELESWRAGEIFEGRQLVSTLLFQQVNLSSSRVRHERVGDLEKQVENL
ncbi:hypothetical protein VITU9109_03117 [Vibrio tubiashii ATCC 19109]|uniref:Uncharacterized protein n=1 Tax=Vibrio tubiashii ATCC 19109 TaxID=1051646 RepID=A0ABP2LHP9_9VIBR|nr:hypothetical protein VITU9109_03117 [Vibrio tubiashii ATCC 19109]